MKKKDEVFVRHILDAVGKIEKYLKGVRYDAFIDDPMRSDAVVRELEIIGEASKQLTADFKSRRSDIAWKEIVGMRDKLIHGYFGVDLQVVWNTCMEDLPMLRRELKKSGAGKKR